MNTPSNAMPESSAQPQVGMAAFAAPIRPLYWSIRREIWENRSIYVAPLVAGALVLLGGLISAITLPRRMAALMTMDPGPQREAISMPYSAIAASLVVTAFIVAVFYCVDALHGERRDRSVLFWKSMPVSDWTTVLSKALIPLLVLPLFTFAIIVPAQLTTLVASRLTLIGDARGTETLLAHVHAMDSAIVALYAVAVVALWLAPIYSWLLLISGWAPRAAFVWAVLPLPALAAVERIVFNSSHFGLLLKDRLIGWFSQAFTFDTQVCVAIDPLSQLTPGKFLSSTGLWIGLVFAIIFLAAAVRLRRYRGPI